MSLSSRWCGALFCAALSLASHAALAQAAPPTVSELLVDPTDDRHLALRSSFGLMLSSDAGATWDWRCKAGMGYRGRAEPPMAILNGGALVVGLPNGISTGDPSGCDFVPAKGIAANVVDVAALTATRGAALAVSVSFESSSSRVWKSLDNGRSFQALGAELPHFTALSLGVPAASQKRVYLTGLLWASSVEGGLAVSDDAGKTFTISALANSDSGTQPFVAAVDPKRPDTIYLRFTGTPGRLRVSDDAGRTFREILAMPGPLQGFALSPSGYEVYASSLEAGTYRADASSLKFERIACDGLPCLAATSSALLGCGERARHGFIAGRSVDHGRTFGVLLDAPCIVPARCGPKTSVGAAFGADWPRISAQIAQRGSVCDRAAPSKPFSRACFDDAGGISGGAARDGGPTDQNRVAPIPQGGAAPVKATAPARGAGCGCMLPRGRTSRAGSCLRGMAALFFAYGWRRRRRARAVRFSH